METFRPTESSEVEGGCIRDVHVPREGVDNVHQVPQDLLKGQQYAESPYESLYLFVRI